MNILKVNNSIIYFAVSSINTKETMEIETTVNELSPRLQQQIGKPLTSKIRIIIEEPKSDQNLSDIKSSKWAKFVEDTKHIDISDETYQHIQKCSMEFREEFTFKMDAP